MPPPSAGGAEEADSLEVAGSWETLLERDMSGKRAVPEPFRTSSDSLRVITTLGLPVSQYSPGLVITNLLSDATAMPVASIRAEQRRIDIETADTTVVEVPRGQLSFFVAEHRGLKDWRVTVQEFRERSGS